MFSWFSEIPKEEQDRRKEVVRSMFYYATKCVNVYVYNYKKDEAFDLDSNECKDEYGNSLLHIAVSSNNIELVAHLVEINMRKDHKNNFGETPVDIALKNRNLNIIKILECDGPSGVPVSKSIKATKAKLVRDNAELTKRNSDLSAINDGLKGSLKRKQTECDEHIGTIKKLRADNNGLKTDNSDLKATVDALRDSFKK